MDKQDFVRIGRAIQARRLKLGMDQKELAYAVSISVSTLSQIENGHVNSAFLTYYKIAIATNINLQKLFATTR